MYGTGEQCRHRTPRGRGSHVDLGSTQPRASCSRPVPSSPCASSPCPSGPCAAAGPRARACRAGGHPAQLNESSNHGCSRALKSMSRIRTATGTRLHTGRRREVNHHVRLAPELFVRLSGHARQTTVGHGGAKKQELWMNPGTALMPLRGRRRDPFGYPPTVGREVRPPNTPTASTSPPCC